MNHINLKVADLDRAVSFYGEQFGFAAAFPVEGGNGMLLKGTHGEVLVVERGTPHPDPGSVFHFGFEAASADEVRTARERLNGAGCREVHWTEGEDYVSVKVADPDGYVIEVFWE